MDDTGRQIALQHVTVLVAWLNTLHVFYLLVLDRCMEYASNGELIC